MDPPPFFDPLPSPQRMKISTQIWVLSGVIDPAEFEYARIFLI
jgi:hypothetical protein